jgi:hypothetical protein
VPGVRLTLWLAGGIMLVAAGLAAQSLGLIRFSRKEPVTT